MAQIILDSNNNLIQGDFDNATLNNRTKLQTTTTNATTNVYVVPNGSSTSAGVSVANNSSLTNASKIVMATNGTTDTQIISGINGSGTYLPLSFYTNNTLGAQLDTSGNFFGTGKMGGVGSVIQVLQAVKTDTFSTTSASGTFADITGLSVSITPSSSSNKILILAEVRAATPSSNGSFIRAMRDATAIYIGNSGGGSRIRVSSQGYNPDGNSNTNQTIMFLDSPATTSSTTYKIQACVGGSSGTVYVNRSDNNSDNVFTGMPTSSITVMEIKG
jgi:hypothetical protein